MADSISRRRAQISELTHLVPIRPGLVPEHERGTDSAPISFANRLRIVLAAFHEREEQGFPSVIRLFRAIHSAQWALIDGDSRLLLSVIFDGDWGDYMRALARDVPHMLHLLWANTAGWERLVAPPATPSADRGRDAQALGADGERARRLAEHARSSERLMRFIRAHQVRVNFLYAHHPELTVRDLAYLKQLRAAVENTPPGQDWHTALRDALRPELEPLATRQRRALERYSQADPAALERAKRRFFGLLSPLYDAPTVRAACLETFGEEPAT